MISVDYITLIIIAQVMFVLFVGIIFLIFLLRKKNTNIKKLIVQAGQHEEESPLASVKFYLTAEAKLTQLRFNQLYKEDDVNGMELTEPDWLALRKGYLEIEKEFLLTEDRVDAFWLNAGKQLKSLLKSLHLVRRIKSVDVKPTDSEDQIDMKKLLKTQLNMLEELTTELTVVKTEDEMKELNTKMSVALRTHTELSHCVNMIGEENEFLSKQINELLKRPV